MRNWHWNKISGCEPLKSLTPHTNIELPQPVLPELQYRVPADNKGRTESASIHRFINEIVIYPVT